MYDFGQDEHGPSCGFPDDEYIEEWEFPEYNDYITVPDRCPLRKHEELIIKLTPCQQ